MSDNDYNTAFYINLYGANNEEQRALILNFAKHHTTKAIQTALLKRFK